MVHSLVPLLCLSATTTLVCAWTVQVGISICDHRSRLGYMANSFRNEASLMASMESDACEEGSYIFNGTVSILDRGSNHIVVSKPPGVLCHRSVWSGSKRKKNSKPTSLPEVPMLQRAREAVGERVNLIHRLDRGASGCLLMSFAKADKDGCNATSTLHESMSLSSFTHKTYIALVRGEGILGERDFRREGWFEVTRPIKNEGDNLKNATSYFRFIAGQGNENGTLDRPRASLVIARIKTGRWHQIRKHLNGLSHPIIGDSTHGNSKTNREWREKWGLQPERTCLHLLKLELPPTSVTPNGISVVDALPHDMMNMLQEHFLPDFLDDVEKALNEEGLCFEPENDPDTVAVNFEIS